MVLQNAGGDPLIGDIGRPEVPMLWDWHRNGRWSPRPLFLSLQVLMERIEVYMPPPPDEVSPTVFYTVHLVDLGDQPLQLMHENVSVTRKDDLVRRFERPCLLTRLRPPALAANTPYGSTRTSF